MVIRATKKLLNISRIEPIENPNEEQVPFPGAWYAGLVPTGRQGKMLIHFLHSSTMLSILNPGKSLNKALPEFHERLEQILLRLGYPKLISKFEMGTEPEIFTTNSRSMLAHMNQMRYAIEYSVAIARGFDEINLSDIEDALSGMLFSSKGSKEYKKPIEILQRLADE
jgi:hypothetical protein